MHRPRAAERKQREATGVEPAFDLSAYYPILIFAGAAAAFALGSLLATHIFPFKPSKPTRVKQMPYESGMDPVGSARMQFDIKFYLIAILFLVFDVELLFLYPWAVSAYETRGESATPVLPKELNGPIFWEVLVFLATLVVAYVYAWRRGVFRWR